MTQQMCVKCLYVPALTTDLNEEGICKACQERQEILEVKK
jgi:hypothetical protein